MSKKHFFNSEFLSPEMKVILQAIQVDQSFDKWGWKNEKNNINWRLVTELGIRHEVLPLVYKYLKRQDKRKVSQEEIDKQHSLFLKNVGRNIQLTQKLLNLIRLLSDHGYEAVPFKGPVLAVQAYDDVGFRVFCDLDILIKTRDFPHVYDLMESQGYLPAKSRIRKMKNVWKRSGRNFEFYDKNSIIDFHQQISQGPRFLSLKEKWDSRISVELNNQPVPSLGIHNTILMLSLHSTHHGWNLLKMVADLAHLVHYKENDIEWNGLIKTAREMGSLRMLIIGLLLSHDFCGLNIPPIIQDLIQRDKKIIKLAQHFSNEALKMKQSHRLPPTAVPRSLDSFFYQFNYLIYYLFNPTNLDVLAIRLPSFLYPMYFIIRPVRLAFNTVKEAVNKI